MRGNILNYTLGIENFEEIALSVTVKEIAKISNLCIFCKTLKIQNFLKSRHSIFFRHPGVENFEEIAQSVTVDNVTYDCNIYNL